MGGPARPRLHWPAVAPAHSPFENFSGAEGFQSGGGPGNCYIAAKLNLAMILRNAPQMQRCPLILAILPCALAAMIAVTFNLLLIVWNPQKLKASVGDSLPCEVLLAGMSPTQRRAVWKLLDGVEVEKNKTESTPQPIQQNAEAPASPDGDVAIEPVQAAMDPVQAAIGGELPPLAFEGSDYVGGAKSELGCWNSDRYNFSFVHIPKNAGSAVVDNLRRILCVEKGGSAEGWKNCDTLRRGQCNQKRFTFTFTRNPWDRAVSMWSYGLKQQQLKFKDFEKRMDLSKRYCSFENFVGNLKKRRPVGGCGAHVDSRQAPAVLSKDNKGRVHFAGRLEYFDRDLRTVLLKIDPAEKLLKLFNDLGFTMHNDSGHLPYQR